LANLGQRFLPAATVVDSEIFKDARAGRGGANDFSNGSVSGDIFHGVDWLKKDLMPLKLYFKYIFIEPCLFSKY
jgi:hypothetical protein